MIDRNKRTAILVADLGYGDAGKGATIDAFAEKYHAHAVVRYNGGAQAAHTVVCPDGRTHTFAQFGSATFIPDVATYLSEYMLLDPLALMNEEAHLRSVGVDDAYTRLFVDERALLLTPFARAANRLRESMRDDQKHGSCGMGIGETVHRREIDPANALYVRDLRDKNALMKKLEHQQNVICDEFVANKEMFVSGTSIMQEEWGLLSDKSACDHIASRFAGIAKKFTIVDDQWAAELFQKSGVILFEGAQGVLIDEAFGFQPYTTWSNITFENAEALLSKYNFKGQKIRLGVLRAYATRHGPGPFVTESFELIKLLPDTHNTFNEWQRDFRVGALDAVATRYALGVLGGVDALVLTNVDRLSVLKEWRMAYAYRMNGNDKDMPDYFGESLGDSIILDIKIVRPAEYNHQEKLAQFLGAVSPEFKTVPLGDDANELLLRGAHPLFDVIEAELGIPVALIGYGPTREQKLWKHETFWGLCGY